jgi:(p)ppGpp synthase/HD superfamily hydrolase
MPLNTKLKNGDIVEILTSKQFMPKIDWLNFVVTKSASSKIRLWFKKYNREDNIDMGKTNLEIALTKAVFDDYMKSGEIEKCALEMNFKSTEDLFASLGYGETTVNKVINKIKRPAEKEELKIIEARVDHHKYKKSKKDDIIGLEGMLWALAKCCSPIPGEPIAGVVTRSRGVTVHRLDCKSLFDIEPERMMDISWANTVTSSNYSAHLRIESQDRIGLLKDIISKISDTNTNIAYANSYLKKSKFGIIDLGIELNSIETLQKVILNLQSIPEVYSVKRLEQKGDSNHAPRGPRRPQKPNSGRKPKEDGQ